MHSNDGRVMCNFIAQALRSNNITIHGDALMPDSEPGFTSPVNLGNTGEFTMLELAESVLSLTGSKSKLAFYPLPTDDPK